MSEFLSRFKDFLGFDNGNAAVDKVDGDDSGDATAFNEEPNDYVVASKEKYSRISGYKDDKKSGNGVIGMAVNANLRIVLSNPASYEESEIICSHLRGHMTVVLNLNYAKDQAEQRRIFDFVSGCAYALDCSIQKVSEFVCVVAPFNVDILAEDNSNTLS